MNYTREQIEEAIKVLQPNKAFASKIIRQLLAENDALREDAARYRWLQKTLYSEDVIMDEARVVFDVSGMCPNIEEFDAAIDTAMQANKGE